MRSSFARIGIAVLLATGSAACIAAPASTGSQAAPCAPPGGPVDRPDYCSYPVDIRDFIDARDACDHWRGEPWPEHEDDPQEVRKKQILDAIDESCTGTDKRLSELKATYANDPKILQLLDEYEPDIETGD